MKTLNEKLERLMSNTPSGWLKKAQFRRENRKWLGYSSNIARRTYTAMEDKEGMNQKTLAERLGVKPQYISKLLKGEQNLSLQTIAKLSEALGVELISFPEYKYSKPLFINEMVKSIPVYTFNLIQLNIYVLQTTNKIKSSENIESYIENALGENMQLIKVEKKEKKVSFSYSNYY